MAFFVSKRGLAQSQGISKRGGIIMILSTTFELLGNGLLQTLYMTIVATVFSYLFGLPLGIILNITSKNGITPNKWIYGTLNLIVNIFRSIPFLILLVFVMPFTKILIGTRIGTTASIVPLVIAAIPFIARMIESSLSETSKGVIEASEAMGTSKFKIIYKVLLPEAKPSLLVGFSISIVTILGYSAMAGFVGGGGLGAMVSCLIEGHTGQIVHLHQFLLSLLLQVSRKEIMAVALTDHGADRVIVFGGGAVVIIVAVQNPQLGSLSERKDASVLLHALLGGIMHRPRGDLVVPLPNVIVIHHLICLA